MLFMKTLFSKSALGRKSDTSLFYPFFALFFCLSVFAQEDGVSDRDDPTRQTVSQNRRMLLDKFNAGRLDAVSDLLDSIEHQRHDPLLLWPAERLLLYYWIERYQAIDSLARHFDEFSMETSTNHPQEQVVWNVLSFHSFENMDTLVKWIDQTGCDDEVFDFRVQLLKTMLNVDGDDQTSVHREIRLMIELYTFDDRKPSPEEQTMMPEQIESGYLANSPWRIAFGVGLGPTFVSGRLANYLSTKANMSFTINANYQQWYFLFLMQPIFTKLNRDIPVGSDGEVWKAGEKAVAGNIGLSFGYSLINSRYFRISPFVGFSVSDCSPSEEQITKNNALADAGIYTGYSTMFGLDSDVKLYNIFSFMRGKNAPVSFNIRLNYIPEIYQNVHTRYSGNMFLVTLGININVSNSG